MRVVAVHAPGPLGATDSEPEGDGLGSSDDEPLALGDGDPAVQPPTASSAPASTTASRRVARRGSTTCGAYSLPGRVHTQHMRVRTVIEHGTKDKRSVAFSLDWPGWSRGAKTPELALETLESYRSRYRPIADLAGMADEFDAAGPLEIVEDRVGTGSTDFWGISFSPSSTEHGPMSEAEFDRKTKLLRAAWAYFDAVAARVSPEMRKGARGGGRDRDRIISHVVRWESENLARGVGLEIPEEGAMTPDGLRAYREAYVEAMRAYNNGEGKRMRTSTLVSFSMTCRHSSTRRRTSASLWSRALTSAGRAGSPTRTSSAVTCFHRVNRSDLSTNPRSRLSRRPNWHRCGCHIRSICTVPVSVLVLGNARPSLRCISRVNPYEIANATWRSPAASAS